MTKSSKAFLTGSGVGFGFGGVVLGQLLTLLSSETHEANKAYWIGLLGGLSLGVVGMTLFGHAVAWILSWYSTGPEQRLQTESRSVILGFVSGAGFFCLVITVAFLLIRLAA
jgi:hypothetical protein